MSSTTPAKHGPISDYVTSHLRQFVPTIYGFIASWLVSLGIPDAVLDAHSALIMAALTTVLSAAWYFLWRAVEPHLPAWLRRLVLGAARAPRYQPTTEPYTVTDVPGPRAAR